MQAIILAAGVGSRLRPIVYDRPKPLTQVADTAIIFHTIDALHSAGVDKIVIVAGYKKDMLIRKVEEKYPNLHVEFVINHDFETTNNSYSLHLAGSFLEHETLVLNADVIFDPRIIPYMLQKQGSCFAVDKSQYIEESMKVTVQDEIVTSISKEITADSAYGCSIDIYKFTSQDSRILKQELITTVDDKHTKNLWTEVVLDKLCRSKAIQVEPLDIRDCQWVEIDNIEDLVLADELFNPALKEIAHKKIFFIDKDGTLTTHNKLIPGAIELIEAIKQKGKIFYVLTNNSSKTKLQHGKELQGLGLNITPDNILVSLDSCIAYLKERNINRVFVLGSDEVREYFVSGGFTLSSDKPQRLILTYDRSLTYQKLIDFIELVQDDIPYYATHLDKLYPTSRGFLPDIGLTIKMIEECTGIHPSRVFGKPDYNFIKPIMDEHQAKAQDAVIIGDRLYTDIKLATENNIFGINVLSGETNRADYENSLLRADAIFTSVAKLVPYI